MERRDNAVDDYGSEENQRQEQGYEPVLEPDPPLIIPPRSCIYLNRTHDNKSG